MLPLCKNASAIVVTESEISNQFMLSFLQVSHCSLNESSVQQERSNCILSSIRWLVWFDWRNFALALAAPIPITELSLQISA